MLDKGQASLWETSSRHAEIRESENNVKFDSSFSESTRLGDEPYEQPIKHSVAVKETKENKKTLSTHASETDNSETSLDENTDWSTKPLINECSISNIL